MQIKPNDGTLATTSASIRPQPGSLRPAAAALPPPDVTQLTGKQPVEGDTVSLSAAVRRLASALREALPELEGTHIAALLTTHDRFVLARALELAQREQLDPKEVRRLLLDLAAYRASERSTRAEPLPAALEPAALLAARELEARAVTTTASQPQSAAEHAQRRLALPTFSARDEQLARQILQSEALHDTAIDQGFVRALVDPDRHPTHAVDFAFLRRLVVALSPGQSEGVDAQVSLAPRLARANLADAIMRLELRASDLPDATPHTLARGRMLLQQSLAARPAPAGSQAERPMYWQLRSSDRALLGLLHLAAEQRQLDPRALERVTHALVALRWAERGQATPAGALATSIPPPRSAAPASPSAAPQPRLSQPPGPPSAGPQSRLSHAPVPAGAGPQPRLDHAPAPASAGPQPRLSYAPGPPSTAPQPRVSYAPGPPSTAPQPRLSYAPAPPSSTPHAPESFAPSASTLEHERELTASLRSRAPRILVPDDGLPLRSSAPPGASASVAPPPPTGQAKRSDSLPPPATRSFGSASQLAARVAGSYGSLAPPPLDAAALAPGNGQERNAALRPTEFGATSPQQAATFARPLDLSQALGLGALLEQARGRRARAASGPLGKPQERTVHAVATAHRPTGEAEADDPLLSAARRERRRVRWQLLIQRRRRRRKQRD